MKGLNFMDVLQIVFVVLKLCNVITWSWWWVMMPTEISLVIIALVLLFEGKDGYRRAYNRKER